ncbi:hypothetical protein DI272_19100 [Streptomyces sp. Act143]|uniref:hypothetical protein n=1 Tax=Streptomyces sp. Act143 TaxID=2200760 RepID=UPI000D68222E|nr:hypothetical protein [Streptomyces sp. Act143]PWI16040.1 hypothetical protein DI272_19100 [Streptomyces sp. Act143]
MKLFRLSPEQAVAVTEHLERARAWFSRLLDTFRAMARRLARTALAVADAFRRMNTAAPAGAANARQRPAWMSPYGPPARRHA